MEPKFKTRRQFVTTSACALGLASFAGNTALANTSPHRVRLEWAAFRYSRHLPIFTKAIASMRANTNRHDPRSWEYWVNVHIDSCTHGVAYFLSWHRGCLFHFERQLQLVSGDNSLMLPYWDYYKYPMMPPEFINPAVGNPLYERRINTNVSQALSMSPFDDSMTNFQSGTSDSFEHTLEARPHNPIHDIIGSVMATMSSPRDPIFWLHHANVDRLWSAWIGAGNGRRMPPRDSPYWHENFSYGPTITMNSLRTFDTRADLNYRYADETLPAGLIPPPAPRRITAFSVSRHPRFRYLRVVDATPRTFASRLQAMQENLQNLPARPPVKQAIESVKRQIDANRLSLAGVKALQLDDKSMSVKLRLASDAKEILHSVVEKAKGSPFGRIQPDPRAPQAEKYSSVQLVLDRVELTALGEGGGYFYKVFMNLRASPDASAPEQRHLIGTFGPFKIAGALNHAKMTGDRSKLVRLAFPATRALANLSESDLLNPVISFVRVSGDHAPEGAVMQIGEARIEVSTENIQ